LLDTRNVKAGNQSKCCGYRKRGRQAIRKDSAIAHRFGPWLLIGRSVVQSNAIPTV